MEWEHLMNDEQNLVDLQFNSIVNTHLLDVDYKAEREAKTLFDKIRETFNFPTPKPQYFIALPIFEILEFDDPMYFDEDDNAI